MASLQCIKEHIVGGFGRGSRGEHAGREVVSWRPCVPTMLERRGDHLMGKIPKPWIAIAAAFAIGYVAAKIAKRIA